MSGVDNDNEGLRLLFVDWVGTEKKLFKDDFLIPGRVLLLDALTVHIVWASSSARLRIGFGRPKRRTMG